MAKIYHKPLRSRVHDAFGRYKKVQVFGKNDEHIATLVSDEDFTDFYDNPNHRQNASHYRYKVEPKNPSNINNVKSALSSFKNIAKSYTKSSQINVDIGDEAQSIYGEKLNQPSTSSSKIIDTLDKNKDSIVNEIPNSKLLEIAQRKNTEQFYKILDESGLNEYSPDGEKAEAIRDFITSRSMTRSKSSIPNEFASGIVWDAAKETRWERSLKTDYGSRAFGEIDETLSRNRSTQRSALKIMDKRVRKRFGGKSTYQRRVFDEIKSEQGFRTDVETMQFLSTDEGKNVYRKKMSKETLEGKINISKANKILAQEGIGPLDLERQNIGKKKLSDTEQKALAGNAILDYSSASPNELSKFLWDRLKDNPEAREALATNDYDKVRQFKPDSVSFNELHAFFGKTPKKQHLRRLKEYGIDITGAPPDIEDYLAGSDEVSYTDRGRGRPKGTGLNSSSSSRSSSLGSSRSVGRRAVTSEGGNFLGQEKIVWRRGEPHAVKEKGRVASWLSEAGGKIKSKVTPKKKDYEKIYRELRERDDLEYLTDDELRYASRANYAVRKNIIRKGRKMFIDRGYRANLAAKKEQKRGIYEAKYLEAAKMAKQRARAATSPWWNAWYYLTHNIWVLIGVFLVLSLLFLPIGLFYVLGWSIAVGMVAVVMFVVWVFIEIWWMIAQGLTALINLIGQIIVGIFNYIGSHIANALGQTFTPFNHQLVQNMNIAERDPITGERKILGITWGQWNLVPPDFLKLNEFMPREFDTDVLIVKIFPALKNFFIWYTQPIADRYTAWIATAEWYYVGAVIGVPIVLVIVGIVLAALYVRRKWI